MICRQSLSQASECTERARGFFFLFLKIKTIMWNSTAFDSSVSADVGISRITGEEKKEVDMTLLRESSSRKPEYSLCF